MQPENLTTHKAKEGPQIQGQDTSDFNFMGDTKPLLTYYRNDPSEYSLIHYRNHLQN